MHTHKCSGVQNELGQVPTPFDIAANGDCGQWVPGPSLPKSLAKPKAQLRSRNRNYTGLEDSQCSTWRIPCCCEKGVHTEYMPYKKQQICLDLQLHGALHHQDTSFQFSLVSQATVEELSHDQHHNKVTVTL